MLLDLRLPLSAHRSPEFSNEMGISFIKGVLSYDRELAIWYAQFVGTECKSDGYQLILWLIKKSIHWKALQIALFNSYIFRVSNPARCYTYIHIPLCHRASNNMHVPTMHYHVILKSEKQP